MAAFPAGYYLDKTTTFEVDTSTRLDYMDDGSTRLRTMSEEIYTEIRARFSLLTLAQKNTLAAFLETNRATTVTWTIDSINYSGDIVGEHTEGMSSGNTYFIEFTYRAVEV